LEISNGLGRVTRVSSLGLGKAVWAGQPQIATVYLLIDPPLD